MSSTFTGLTAASTPLTGTEVLGMDQGGATVKATAQDIANLGVAGSNDHSLLTNRDLADAHPADAVSLVTTNFDGALSGIDTDVQTALETLDDVVGAIDTTSPVIAGSTVATLPAAVTGAIRRVTDASAPALGSTVVGGGAAAALVWYNGAAWTVIGI